MTLGISALAIVIALAAMVPKISDIRWKMSLFSAPVGSVGPITIPLETVQALDEHALLMFPNTPEYFGVKEGYICIKSDTEARVKFGKSEDGSTRLVAEPGIEFCKPLSFWHRFWWAVRN